MILGNCVDFSKKKFLLDYLYVVAIGRERLQNWGQQKG